MTLRLRIGPAIIAIVANRPPDDLARASYLPFVYSGQESPTLMIRIHTDPPPSRGEAPLIGQLATQWDLFKHGSGYRLEIFEQIQFRPKQIALINHAFDQADVYLLEQRGMPEYPQARWFLALLMNPFLQWWLTAHLARQAQGLVVHASAVALRGLGLAFVGPSGAGKTTIVRRCRDGAGAVVLNDERILIWRDEQGFQVSGTPWPGELQEASPLSVPLAGVFALRKGETNRLEQLLPIERVSRFVPEAFLPIWSPEAMAGLLETSDRLLREVPSGELQFVNGPSIVDYVVEYVNERTASPRGEATVGAR